MREPAGSPTTADRLEQGARGTAPGVRGVAALRGSDLERIGSGPLSVVQE